MSTAVAVMELETKPMEDANSPIPIEIAPTHAWTNSANTWRFLLLIEGQATCRSSRPATALFPGDLLVLHPNADANLYTHSTTTLSAQLFQFQPDDFAPLLTLADRLALHHFGERSQGHRILQSTSATNQEITRLLNQKLPPQPLAQRANLLLILALLLNREPTPSTPIIDPNPDAPTRLRHILNHLPHDALINLSAGSLAKQCHCSRRHLTRLVQHEFGCSFAQLKMQVRLEKAAQMLRESDTKIISVAMECGFNQPSLFSAHFRRHYGFSPSAWRHRQTEGEKPEERRQERETGEHLAQVGTRCPASATSVIQTKPLYRTT